MEKFICLLNKIPNTDEWNKKQFLSPPQFFFNSIIFTLFTHCFAFQITSKKFSPQNLVKQLNHCYLLLGFA